MPSLPISASAPGVTHVLPAPGAGLWIEVWGYVLKADAAVHYQWQSTPTGQPMGMLMLTWPSLSGPMDAGSAGDGNVAPVASGEGEPWFRLPQNAGLDLYLDSAVAVAGHLVYTVRGQR